MAQSYIGKPISLISHSDVRYRGILAGIDPAASTIQLSNVYSMGTESRRPSHEFIPPVQEPYQYIIFRASEVKDLAVDEPVPARRSVHDDPAVLGASAQVANPSLSPYPVSANHIQPHPQQPPPPQQQPPYPSNNVIPAAVPQQPPQPQVITQPQVATQVQQQQQLRPNGQGPRRSNHNSVHTAAASLEKVERAIGDLRVSQAQAQTYTNSGANGHNGHIATRGSRRGGGGRGGGLREPIHTNQIKVPATDFDFESMNAKFDKASLSTSRSASAAGGAKTPEEREKNAEGEKAGEAGDKDDRDAGQKGGNQEPEVKAAYNPQKSFFDSLTSGNPPPSSATNGSGGRGGRRGGGRGGGMGRNRREEERERNVATFGEPGGVGLMGPGAYVGGWGGYGRRGGRPRRGTAAPQGVASSNGMVPARV